MKQSVTCCFDPGASSLAGLFWPRKNTFNSLLEYCRRNQPVAESDAQEKNGGLTINVGIVEHTFVETNGAIKAKLSRILNVLCH